MELWSAESKGGCGGPDCCYGYAPRLLSRGSTAAWSSAAWARWFAALWVRWSGCTSLDRRGGGSLFRRRRVQPPRSGSGRRVIIIVVRSSPPTVVAVARSARRIASRRAALDPSGSMPGPRSGRRGRDGVNHASSTTIRPDPARQTRSCRMARGQFARQASSGRRFPSRSPPWAPRTTTRMHRLMAVPRKPASLGWALARPGGLRAGPGTPDVS